MSMDKSQVTKLRRSLEVEESPGGTGYRDDRDGRHDNNASFGPKDGQGPGRRERSLSPFSKRVALTQAMNM
jgi:hypothetical protein